MPRPAPTTHPRFNSSPASRAASARVATPSLDGDPTQAQLERILKSRTFTGAHRSQLFLRYIVERALAYPDEPLKEYGIALDVFERDPSYDPAINNTVRVEAGRLRSRLLEYYAGEGSADPLLIEVPRGAYRAVIRPREPITAPSRPALLLVPPANTTSPAPRHRLSWIIPVAFLLGAFLGYRASH